MSFPFLWMSSLIYISSCGLNITKPNSTTLGVSTNYQYYHWRCGAIYLGELENFRQQKKCHPNRRLGWSRPLSSRYTYIRLNSRKLLIRLNSRKLLIFGCFHAFIIMPSLFLCEKPSCTIFPGSSELLNRMWVSSKFKFPWNILKIY